MIAGATGQDGATCTVRDWGIETLDAGERQATDPATGSWVALSGRFFSDRGAAGSLRGGRAASVLLSRLSSQGRQGIDAADGAFAVAWWDAPARRLSLFRDPFGIEPLFYSEAAGQVAFASRVRDLPGGGSGDLSPQGLVEYLVWGYVPGDATLDRGVHRVPPGDCLVFEPGKGLVERRPWYRLSFEDPTAESEAEIEGRFRGLLEQAVARRLAAPPVGALLSGGMDSSSVVTFARRLQEGPIRTFAFRCAGQSFDESHYARALAEALGCEHTEVGYGEEQALRKEEAVREMDVPFGDIGIVTGSWLLGAAARGRTSFVLTGDGGDELWGSHPVYSAQRIVGAYERLPIPGAVTRLLQRAASLLPDSERKRDLRVKLKKILPLEGLPGALGPFRWRAHWTPGGLAGLLTPAAHEELRAHDPFRAVLDAYEGYAGPDDGLSAHLYNDYRTASGFYFSRLRLLRAFGIEARAPFYDRDLVEYGARIPARLKLEGLERTKRLFRAAMRGVLPAVIQERKDKLGHSVPLKNWLRGDGPLARRIDAVLCREALVRRGLFRPEVVERLRDEHRRMRHNHSHRLWSLYVLESWLQARESRDRTATSILVDRAG